MRFDMKSEMRSIALKFLDLFFNYVVWKYFIFVLIHSPLSLFNFIATSSFALSCNPWLNPGTFFFLEEVDGSGEKPFL